MLKQYIVFKVKTYLEAATFGWLCVETFSPVVAQQLQQKQPPSGGCVLKPRYKTRGINETGQPPSGGCVLKQECVIARSNWRTAATFGWLCVETDVIKRYLNEITAATFGWLCVETTLSAKKILELVSSHLRVAVC